MSLKPSIRFEEFNLPGFDRYTLTFLFLKDLTLGKNTTMEDFQTVVKDGLNQCFVKYASMFLSPYGIVMNLRVDLEEKNGSLQRISLYRAPIRNLENYKIQTETACKILIEELSTKYSESKIKTIQFTFTCQDILLVPNMVLLGLSIYNLI